jgi:hypothetical protein
MMRFPVRVVCVLTILTLLGLGFSADSALALAQLSRGHNILLGRGLQIQASCPEIPATFENWDASNFTGAFFWGTYPTTIMPPAPGVPWGVSYRAMAGQIPNGTWDRYASQLTFFQYFDEQDVTDQADLAALRTAMDSFHVSQPQTITYTNQWGSQHSAAQIQTYMQQVHPDMLCFDTYPFNGSLTGGSPTAYYSYMEKYRKCGLAGNDGTGTTPIPVAFWTSDNSGHPRSGSEERLNSFSGWAFGCKAMILFNYTGGAMFPEHSSTTNPTPNFYRAAETNQQSDNLGPALVRLLSTDVHMKMGKHSVGLAQVTNTLPTGVASWHSEAVPYITGISATNLGSKNSGLAGDVIVGSFKPLDASFTNAGHANDAYFMIVNGLSDATGSAADCRQTVHVEFDFGASGIDSLLRLSRDTGCVEQVSLTHLTGSQYSLNLTLDGGTGDLFKFDNGGLFVIPEPGTMCLLGNVLGVLAVWGLRRRGSAGMWKPRP